MKRSQVHLKDGTVVTIFTDHGGLPVLKLLSWHAPLLVIEAWRTENDPIHIGLGQINFDQPVARHTINEPNPPRSISTVIEPNIDRAQLAKLGE